MLKEPGNLSDLNQDAQKAWHKAIVKEVEDALRDSGSKHFRLLPDESWPDGVSVVDWDAFPNILQNCIGDEKASQLCDWKTPNGDLGRVLGQDEYCEWRTVRNSDNKLIRVEFTTELAKYWEVLASYHPLKTLRILGRFAGEEQADWTEVYGTLNPFHPSVTPEQRGSAFNEMMVRRFYKAPVKSPYNNGQKAIAFLCKPVSSLRAAVQLFVTAAIPYGKEVNGEKIALNGAEAIASTDQQAVDCRNSDPNMVGRMNEIVWNEKAVSFDDPVGVYVRSFANNVLLTPDGDSMPDEWVEYQRGSRPHNGIGEERSQRLVIEVPPGMGFVLGDMINKDTEEKIEYGYQLAELVKVACYFKESNKGDVQEPKKIVSVDALADCTSPRRCVANRRTGESWSDLHTQSQQENSLMEIAGLVSNRNDENGG